MSPQTKLSSNGLCQQDQNSIPVSGLVIQEKAIDFAKMLGIADFKASNG